jgi:hypothetical protein
MLIMLLVQYLYITERKLTGEQKILQNEKLRNMYCLTVITRMSKSKKEWPAHVIHMAEDRNT